MWLWWIDGMEGDLSGTRTIFLTLSDSQGLPIAGVSGTLTIGHLPQQLSAGQWLVRQARTATSDASGRIEWVDVPIGAVVLVEIPAARIAAKLTISAGSGDLQF